MGTASNLLLGATVEPRMRQTDGSAIGWFSNPAIKTGIITAIWTEENQLRCAITDLESGETKLGWVEHYLIGKLVKKR